MNIKRGDIFYADLSPVVGEEYGGICPVLVVSNDNKNDTVIVVAISSKPINCNSPFNITFDMCGIFPYTVLVEHIRTIDKSRLKENIGCLDVEIMKKVDSALLAVFGI